MKMKIAKRRVDVQSDAIVIGTDHDRLLPFSRPSNGANTIVTSMIAPEKSMRRSLRVHCDLWMSDGFKTKATIVGAKMQMDTYPRKDLGKSARLIVILDSQR